MYDVRPYTRARRVAAALAAAGLLLGLAACGGDDDDDDASSGITDTTEAESGGNGDSGGGDATLEVTESEFQDVSASAGGSLAVTNSSGLPHTFTADDDTFDEELPDGETVDVPVPSEPGEYPFHCTIHPSMQATLTVQ
jgi:plastocyanin